MSDASLPKSEDLRDLTVDEVIERFLTEYLAEEKGRPERTIGDYRNLRQRWFSPTIGTKAVKRIDSVTIDDLFGAMRRAGLSSSRLNQARSLYAVLSVGQAPGHHDTKSNGRFSNADQTIFESHTVNFLWRGGAERVMALDARSHCAHGLALCRQRLAARLQSSRLPERDQRMVPPEYP